MAYGRGEGPGIAAGLLAAFLIALGLAVSGVMISDGIVHARTVDRRVTVKGLAEREVRANLAVWPMTVAATGDELAAVQAEIDADVAALEAFLVGKGFDEAEISLGLLRVEDRVAMSWNAEIPPGGRYRIEQPVRVRSANVDLVAQASRELGEVVRQGVVLSGWDAPSFVFNRLNDIKPDMLQEATLNAREAAMQFADQSGASLGGIREANQGVFSILPRDEAPGEIESAQIFKRVRVVSTITYQLTD
ncbi:MAG: SIMPL domain-containing protein [Maricaulaceae bacterium]|jgi:hypothetical protein